jgi:integrase
VSSRAKGDGSLFFDRKRQVWVGRVDVPGGPGSERVRRSVTAKNRNDAATKLRALRGQVESGAVTAQTDRRLTVKQLLERWLAAGHRWAPTTVSNYRYAAGLVIELLGSRPAGRLTVGEVEDALSSAAAGFGEHRPLGHHVVGRMRHVLSASLAWGARRELIPPRNPAAIAHLPEATAPAEQRALTLDEARALLDAAKGERLEVLAHLGLMGLRPGEVLGLQWSAVDRERGLVAIVASLRWPAGSEPVLVDPKGGPRAGNRSYRVLRMPAPALEAMRSHGVEQQREAMAMGSRWPAEWSGLVVRSQVGTPLHPRNHRRLLRQWARSAGIDGNVSRYLLRHTTASLLYDQGLSDSQVADWLGNTQVVARRHYIHAVNEFQAAGGELLEAMLSRDADSNGSLNGSLELGEGDAT